MAGMAVVGGYNRARLMLTRDKTRTTAIKEPDPKFVPKGPRRRPRR